MRDKMTEALKRYFGHGEFRRPQDEIIASILEGKDTLAIMPTGGRQKPLLPAARHAQGRRYARDIPAYRADERPG